MTRLSFASLFCFCAPKVAPDRTPFPLGTDEIVTAAPPRARKAPRPVLDTLRPQQAAKRALSQDFARLRQGVLAFIDDFTQLQDAAADLVDAPGAADLAALLQAARPGPTQMRGPGGDRWGR